MVRSARARVALGAVVAGAACFGPAFAACSSFGEDAEEPIDAGAEPIPEGAAVPEAAAPADAADGPSADVALVPDPQLVVCGGGNCTVPSKACCLEPSEACAYSCDTGPYVECDERDDCPSPSICCVYDALPRIVCSTSCPATAKVVCKTPCAPGVACLPHSCGGHLVGLCDDGLLTPAVCKRL